MDFTCFDMKPLLFIDFDGTLCHDRFWRSADDVTKGKIQDFLFNPKNPLVAEWMKGKHTSEDINQILAKELDVDYQKLWDIFVEDCKTMKISDEVLNHLAILKNKYITILSTDNMDCLDRFTVPSLKLDLYFDAILNSYNERSLKIDNNGNFF